MGDIGSGSGEDGSGGFGSGGFGSGDLGSGDLGSGFAGGNADVNALSTFELAGLPSGMTPLAIAASTGHEDIVAALIARNADVNYRSPLVLAAAQGFVGIVERLLRSGAIVNQACGESAAMCGGLDNLGATALHAAARLAHPAIVQALLDYNADPRATTIFGADPRSLANDAARRSAADPAYGARLQEKGGGQPEEVLRLLDRNARDRTRSMRREPSSRNANRTAYA